LFRDLLLPTGSADEESLSHLDVTRHSDTLVALQRFIEQPSLEFRQASPDFGCRNSDLPRSARKLSNGWAQNWAHSTDQTRTNSKKSLISLVGGAGFEPATPGL
jgi:hypothetical protein